MPIQTPICDFGQKAHDFKLKSTDNKIISLDDVKGENGTLIMFICNHCPYVIHYHDEIKTMISKYKEQIRFMAISSNDVINYPEDSPEKMKILFKNLFCNGCCRCSAMTPMLN